MSAITPRQCAVFGAGGAGIEMRTEDRARFVEEVLVMLMSVTDKEGLKVRLSADDEVAILADAITAVNNRRTDHVLFAPVSISLRDLT